MFPKTTLVFVACMYKRLKNINTVTNCGDLKDNVNGGWDSISLETAVNGDKR